MKWYLFDSVGFIYGEFNTFADAYEEMLNLPSDWDDLFITTVENPWRKIA